MLSFDMSRVYPSAKTLVADKVASRICAKDADLYSFSQEARDCAAEFMDWVDLASNPPVAIDEIMAFAQEMWAKGLKTVVLVGQGGSTQAPMTLTKYNKIDENKVDLKTLDSDSPVRVRSIMAGVDPRTTLVIHSSKSGGTLEPRMAMQAVRAIMAETLSEEEIPQHLVAITDPGSSLQEQAEREGWLRVFEGSPGVGGRFSALSVFGLVPAALVGINLHELMADAARAQEICSEDAIENPAVGLASFLFDNYKAGRNKFSFLTPKRGRVLGLWIEQLVAESLGKEGQGILPNIEVDPLLLATDPGDRTIITYETKNDLLDETTNFDMSLAYVDETIPRLRFRVEDVCELAEHFVLWEYAIAMVGYLMQVCPFDQPDVAAAKAETLRILEEGIPEPTFVQDGLGGVALGAIEVRLGDTLPRVTSVTEALEALLASTREGDYFAINAFLPFDGEGRREALELIRHSIAEHKGMVSCLEVGPRYLHSTGQLQKGGTDNGVFLLISANENRDIILEDAPAASLGELEKAQAIGDLITLNSRGRRCLHLHLPDNAGVTLRVLGNEIASILSK